MLLAMVPPICTAAPSRPADPPVRCVSVEHTNVRMAMRIWMRRVPRAESMTRLLPRLAARPWFYTPMRWQRPQREAARRSTHGALDNRSRYPARPKRPGGNAHGERNDNDEREQLGTREHVAGIAARVGGQELLRAGELVATADDQVGRREGSAVFVLTGVIRRVECIFTFIDKSHNVLLFVVMHAL